jgi:hypothetical protein
MSFFIGNRLEKSYFHNRRLSDSAACGGRNIRSYCLKGSTDISLDCFVASLLAMTKWGFLDTPKNGVSKNYPKRKFDVVKGRT